MNRVRRADAGFTMIELAVVLGILGIIIAMAIPEFSKLRESARYRDAARGIASTLRDARARAVAQNREYRVNFNVVNHRYVLERNDGTSTTAIWNAVSSDWTTFGPDVDMKWSVDCDETDDTTIKFNPNGSGNNTYICVMGKDGVWRFKSGVNNSTTGRVVVLHP